MSRQVQSLWHRVEQWRRADLVCARIIISDPARYPGVLQTWARMVLARYAERRAA
jgi:hypothetical protein